MRSKFHGGDTARPAANSSFGSRFTGSIRKGKKSRAALALAISLWIANGGVASAENVINYDGTGTSLTKVTLGEFEWGTDAEILPTVWTDLTATTIDATGFRYKGTETDARVAKNTTANILQAPGLTTRPVTGGTDKTVAVETQDDDKGIKFEATATGDVKAAADIVQYVVKSVTLTSVNLDHWDGNPSGVPQDWTGSQVTVSTGNFNVPALAAGQSRDILTTRMANYFGTVSGDRKYSSETFENSEAGVTLSGNHIGGVKVEDYVDENNVTYVNAKLTYYAETMDTTAIALGEMTWGTARDASGMAYNYANVTDANLNVSGLTFTNPEDVTGTTTLLAANDTLPAGLADVAKPISYQYNPVAGVTVEGAINGSVSKNGANIVYTATENKANKLTFGDVAWKDSGALMTRPANITFNGADVDTTNINFTNIQSLEANKKMTLVSDFGNSVGTITGAKYKVGSTLEGTGKASLVGNDLIFTAETGTSQEQTHNTVMGAEVGMAALSAGNDFIGAATEGLALASNIGADGVSSFANMGGGSMRQETGSHVDTHTWNAILALGHKNEKERGTMEYGAFFEYGTGNYTTHNGDERGDGSMHYTGGGLLAKWTAKHGMYVEGSLRAGSVHDDARNVLRDGNGVPYSYETNAPYFGGHLGVGKEISLANGNVVDVYGKYFYNRRNGVSFDAGGHYDLDAVTSQTIRVGARYIVKRDKWNFYAGAAYEHELDGKAAGKADGVEIRGADTSGASLRGELGATMKPGENSPWSLDLNVSGFAGKKRGFTGGVSVAFMF